MTRQDYLTCTDPAALLAYLRDEDETPARQGRPLLTDRKLRIFAARCYLVAFGRPLNAIESTWKKWEDGEPDVLTTTPEAEVRSWSTNPFYTKHRPAMADLLRSLINPFAAPLPAEFRTPLVVGLAEGAYLELQGKRECDRCIEGEQQWGERCTTCRGTGTIDDGTLDPDRLAVLSDALEDAVGGGSVECMRCSGYGCLIRAGKAKPASAWSRKASCPWCDATGRIPHPLLAALRESVARWRGFWPIDMLTGRG